MARKKVQPNPKVVLVDVNNVLHVGDKAPHSRNFSVNDINGVPFRTGGITEVLKTIRRADYDINRDIFVFCFDRRSFRKEQAYSLGVDYKGGREKMSPDLIVQSDFLFEWLPKMGFNALGLDGLESDDIIYSVAYHAKKFGIEVDILSVDRDLAVSIDEKTRLVSPNSKVPSVSFDNYEFTIGASKGHTIPYNSILLYKAICGDSSDNIPAIVKQPYAMFRRIINMLQENGFDLSSLSDPEVVKDVLNDLEGPAKESALNNLELIKPVLLESEQVPMKKLELNKEAILEFSTILSSKLFAKKFGLEIKEYPEYVTKTRLELTRKVAELRGGSAYVMTAEGEEQPSDAIQALTDIEKEEQIYANVGKSLIQKEQTQTSETDETIPHISTDALE